MITKTIARNNCIEKFKPGDRVVAKDTVWGKEARDRKEREGKIHSLSNAVITVEFKGYCESFMYTDIVIDKAIRKKRGRPKKE
jgi:hypothetical protein